MRKGTLAAFALLAACAPAAAKEFAPSTAGEIVTALREAGPGDVITIAPGVYALPPVKLDQSGKKDGPITLRASKLGEVTLVSRGTELFKVKGSDWIFENLDIAGACADDSTCEHAFHIAGLADRVVIRHNRIRDFNAHIKGNGEATATEQGPRIAFPYDVRIEDNWLFGTHVRHTDNPIAPVDVVGGGGWIVRGNLIADYAKTLDHPAERTDDWSYALFFKGNASKTQIEGNVVLCADRLPAQPYTRGLSLGGSATGPQYCEGSCDSDEAKEGSIGGNLVMACGAEPGIYLFRATTSEVAGNTLVGTGGILAVAPATTGEIEGNLLGGGAITAEKDAKLRLGANRIVGATMVKPPPAKLQAIAAYRAEWARFKDR